MPNTANVLMIDDNYNVETISEAINSKGHQVEIAANLADALGVLKKRKNELNAILLDLDMSAIELPPEYRGLCKDRSAGFVFYKYILVDEYSALAKHTMIISGHLKDFEAWLIKHESEFWNELCGSKRVISKDDPNLITKIVTFLNKCKK